VLEVLRKVERGGKTRLRGFERSATKLPVSWPFRELSQCESVRKWFVEGVGEEERRVGSGCEGAERGSGIFHEGWFKALLRLDSMSAMTWSCGLFVCILVLPYLLDRSLFLFCY
jgi:hypothetical protein